MPFIKPIARMRLRKKDLAVNSANYNGLNQYNVASALPFDFSSNENLSMFVWFKTTNTARNMVLNVDGNLGQNIFIEINATFLSTGAVGKISTGIYGQNANWDTNHITSSGIVNDGNWHSVGMSYNDNTGLLSLYVDGSLDNSLVISTPVASDNTMIYTICRNRNNNSNYHSGGLYSPMNFDRALTGQEFSDLHNDPVICYSDISTTITDDCVYAPRMGNYNGNAGQELVDRSGSGITLSDPSSVPFTATGLSVECSN